MIRNAMITLTPWCVVILAIILIMIRVALAQIRFETMCKGREYALLKGRKLLAQAEDVLLLEDKLDETSVSNFRIRHTSYFGMYSQYVSFPNTATSEKMASNIQSLEEESNAPRDSTANTVELAEEKKTTVEEKTEV